MERSQHSEEQFAHAPRQVKSGTPVTAPRTRRAVPLDRWDALCLVFLFGLLTFYLVEAFDFTVPPREDAAILMRYAKHMASGHGIVWNPGGEPVDGATDFLLMVALAGLVKAGLSVEHATRSLGITSHALTCLILYIAIRRVHSAPHWAALLSAAYLAVGPGLRYVEAYFGTPFFAVFGCTTWVLAYHVFRQGESRATAVLFAVSSLILGLTRPEGVFLSAFILAALLLTSGWHSSRRMVFFYVLLFVVPGAVYFVWRWSYFGHPLPNPYYIKGWGQIHPQQLVLGVKHMILLSLPFGPLFLYAGLVSLADLLSPEAGRRDHGGRETFFVFFPLAMFTALGVFHSGLMNYMMRFTYVALPLVLLSWPPLLAMTLKRWTLTDAGGPDLPRGRLRGLLLVTLFVVMLAPQWYTYRITTPRRSGTLDVARILSDYQEGYTIALTSAGLLPLYSGWTAVDALGLNDPWIAQNGVTEELLDGIGPEVIQFDAHFSPLRTPRDNVETPWAAAIAVLQNYAEQQEYILAAAYGRFPDGADYYYVRSDFPDSAEIVTRIREMEYYFPGGLGVDYASLASRLPRDD